MPGQDGRQSFNRGLEILRLLAERGPMSGAALARELGIDQSSASRLLRSLQRAKLVRKPKFHRFDLDYGLLYLAGLALKRFSLAPVSASICAGICEQHGLGAAAGILHNGRPLFLAWIHPDRKHALRIVDDFSIPIWRSALGLVLSARQGRKTFLREIGADLKADGRKGLSATACYRDVSGQLASLGYYVFSKEDGRPHSAAMPFNWEDQDAAIAVFSPRGPLKKAGVGGILKAAVRSFEASA